MTDPREHGIGRQLWDELEEAQGRSFVSDAMVTMSDAECLAFARLALPHARHVVRVLARICRTYEVDPSPSPESPT